MKLRLKCEIQNLTAGSARLAKNMFSWQKHFIVSGANEFRKEFIKRVIPLSKGVRIETNKRNFEVCHSWILDAAEGNITKTGERLYHFHSIPPTEISHTEDAVTFYYRSFDIAVEHTYSLSSFDKKLRESGNVPVDFWNSSLSNSLPNFDFGGITFDGKLNSTLYTLDALSAFERYGFLTLDSASITSDLVALAKPFGHIKETNNGSVFEVKSCDDPHYACMGFTYHLENPCRKPVSSVQVFLCMTQGDEECDFIKAVDGFAAADRLKREFPEHYKTLSENLATFEYYDDECGVILKSSQPIIALDVHGKVERVSFSNRSFKPPVLETAEAMEAFYEAVQSFTEIIESPESAVHIKLNPRQILLLDNRRILHAFKGNGSLKSCFVDADHIAGTRRFLSTNIPEADLETAGCVFAKKSSEILEMAKSLEAFAYGEDLDTWSHSAQAAICAKNNGDSDELIIAALLHDMGHHPSVCGDSEQMHCDSLGHIGADGHDEHGAKFVREAGLGDHCAQLVANHIKAKRYLVTVNPDYYNRLSLASMETLKLQGGKLSAEEVSAFEKEEVFAESVQLRYYDEEGKIPNFKVPDESWMLSLIRSQLRKVAKIKV